MSQVSSFKKIIIFVLLISFTISGVFAVSPKKTEAAVPTFDVMINPVQFPAQLGFKTIEKIKEWGLDKIAWHMAKKVIRDMTDYLAAWIRGENPNEPRFIQDFGDYLKEAGDIAGGMLLEQIFKKDAKLLCEPWRLQIALDIFRPRTHRDSFEFKAECKISDVLKAASQAGVDITIKDFYEDFDKGGWGAFLTMSLNDASNPIGSYLMTLEEKEKRTELEKEKRKLEATVNKGLKLGMNCIIKDENGKCVKSEILTPGVIIEGALSETFNSEIRQLELADEIDELIAAAIDAIRMKRLFKGEGLMGWTGGDSYQPPTTRCTDPNDPSTCYTPPDNPYYCPPGAGDCGGGNGGESGGGGSGSQCSDGKDNDGDGLVDTDDPGCSSNIDNDESDSSPYGNDAAFVSVSDIPSQMVIGQTYAVTVKMRNTGATTWTSADVYRLGSQDPENNNFWGLARVAPPHNVAPGEIVDFNFNVTPQEELRARAPVTLQFNWKMLQESGGRREWFGQKAKGGAVEVVEDISSKDTIPPTISITSPGEGDTVSGAITISASASDDVGIKEVKFFVNGVQVGDADNTEPYQISYDTTQTANGEQQIKATAIDTSNNTKDAYITVNIQNTQTQTITLADYFPLAVGNYWKFSDGSSYTIESLGESEYTQYHQYPDSAFRGVMQNPDGGEVTHVFNDSRGIGDYGSWYIDADGNPADSNGDGDIIDEFHYYDPVKVGAPPSIDLTTPYIHDLTPLKIYSYKNNDLIATHTLINKWERVGTITTPAGTFSDVILWTESWGGNPGLKDSGFDLKLWLTKGVGWIKFGEIHYGKDENGNPVIKSQKETSLTEYNIK